MKFQFENSASCLMAEEQSFIMKDIRAAFSCNWQLESKIEKKIQQDRCFTIGLNMFFLKISRTDLYETFSGGLGYIKVQKPVWKSLKEDVSDWFNNLAAIEYTEGIRKLIECYNKCFSLNDDHMGKLSMGYI